MLRRLYLETVKYFHTREQSFKQTKIYANLTDFRLLLESLALSDVAHNPATETYNTRNTVREAKTKYMLLQTLQSGDKFTVFSKIFVKK